MADTPGSLELVRRHHDALPLRIREYLNHRGILDAIIDLHLLGWNGERITIPIFGRDGRLAFFKLARDPEDPSPGPKMITPAGARAELYGWERVRVKPCSIIACEGEFDRLVLESQGFAAVTSTAGAGVFHPEWADELASIPEVYVCFDRDEAGRRGVEQVARLVPQAKIVDLPAEVGPGGDVTDFFVTLRRSRDDFLRLLEAAQPMPQPPPSMPSTRARLPTARSKDENIESLKSVVPIEEVVGRYALLRRSGANYAGLCPFHEDRVPSLVVYPESRSFHCFGCQAHGDVLEFLMKVEHVSFPEALEILRRLAP